MLPPPQKYATWLAILRIATGASWLAHGIPKLLNPKFFGPDGIMADSVAKNASGMTGAYHDFLLNVVLPNAGLFSHLVAWGETLTGVSLLLGLFTRVGGIVGTFLALNYFMMHGSYAHVTDLGGLDFATLALSFINIVLPTGLVFGLDAMLPRSRARTQSAGEA